MSRHAKNNTASSYFTHHERAKLNYGTKKQRLGKDSLQQFDCCCITLVPAVDPVVTPEGYLYSKEAIYENLLNQKQEYQRVYKLWEEQQKRLQEEALEKEIERKEEDIKKFELVENSILPVNVKERKIEKALADAPSNHKARMLKEDALKAALKSNEGDLDKRVEEHAKVLRAFWVPGVQEDAKETIIKKPSSKTICPQSGKPLRLKQLLPVQFVPLKNASASESDKLGRWMCPLCYTPLSNKVAIGVLKTSKKVMCRTCIDKLVRPEMRDPLTNKPVREKDIILMKSGGTGFAGKEDQKLVATKFDIAFVG